MENVYCNKKNVFFYPVIDWLTTFNFVLHFLRSSASLFSPAYVLTPKSFFTWEMYEFLSLSGDLRPSIAPYIIVWCNSSPWRRTCPIMCHRRRFITFNNDLVSPTWVSKSSFITLFALLFFFQFVSYLESFNRSLFRFIYNPCLTAI